MELRNLDAARRFVVEGFHLQRAVKPSAANVPTVLGWAMELACSKYPLPPVGFVADVGHIALGSDVAQRTKDFPIIPHWSKTHAERYDDYVLGKLYTDWAFERASDAVRAYRGKDQHKDRDKGIAFIANQIRERCGCEGVFLPPAAIRGLQEMNPEDVLAIGRERLETEGPMPELQSMYAALIAACRRAAEILDSEDVLELEQRTAMSEEGPSVALQQVRRAAKRLIAGLPARPVRPRDGRKEVPTRVLDEDQYPVGGYTSLATKGSIESLLHSQLAYIEPPPGERPDLFDVKYARDELYYYSRDENQFLRHRRAFVFAFSPELHAARFKDPQLPFQPIVMVQSAIMALERKLTDWLSTDAIRFDILFVQHGEKQPLGAEATLMELLFRGAINRGDGIVKHVKDHAAVREHLNELARNSQVHCLAIAPTAIDFKMDNVVVTNLIVDGPLPKLDGDPPLEGEDAFDVWQETVLRILQLWI